MIARRLLLATAAFALCASAAMAASPAYIANAVAAFGDGRGLVELASPATCEAIYRAIQKQRARIC